MKDNPALKSVTKYPIDLKQLNKLLSIELQSFETLLAIRLADVETLRKPYSVCRRLYVFISITP
jgi:hypothetical protein